MEERKFSKRIRRLRLAKGCFYRPEEVIISRQYVPELKRRLSEENI